MDQIMDKKQQKLMIKETFNTVSNGYDCDALRFFRKSARHLVSYLELQGNEHVLDVATGTGHAALSIAANLPQGRVTGVDFSSGMLEYARQKAASQNVHNVEFMEMDMQALEFPSELFDIAVCAFGIFFVDNMETQLSHIINMVKPGGKIAISSFEEDYFFRPLINLTLDRLTNYGVQIPPNTWKQVATEANCKEFFEQTGLKNVKVKRQNVGYYLKDATEWWSILWNGGYRRLISQLPADDLERYKSEHLHEVNSLKTKDGIWLDVGVLFTIGTNHQ